MKAMLAAMMIAAIGFSALAEKKVYNCREREITAAQFDKMYAYFSQCLFKMGKEIVDARNDEGRIRVTEIKPGEYKFSKMIGGSQKWETFVIGAKKITQEDFEEYIKQHKLFIYTKTSVRGKLKWGEKPYAYKAIEFSPFNPRFPAIDRW